MGNFNLDLYTSSSFYGDGRLQLYVGAPLVGLTMLRMVALVGLVSAQGPQVSRHVGRWRAPPCSGSDTAHCAQNVDGPLMGNGDLGAMLGTAPGPRASSGSNITFWLTKNDFWNLAVEAEDSLCRYGTFNNTLIVPPMALDTGCNTSTGSATRNSQATAGGVWLHVLDQGGSNSSASSYQNTTAWAATQHLDNATVLGAFELATRDGQLTTLRTRSFVAAAPVGDVAARISFLVTAVSATRALRLEVGTSAQRPVAGSGFCSDAGDGTNGGFAGTSANASTPAPKDGLRAGKPIVVALATRVLANDDSVVDRSCAGNCGAPGTPGAGAEHVELAEGALLWIVTAVVSSVDVEDAGGRADANAAARAAVLALDAAGVHALGAAHTAWWATFWTRSTIDLPSQMTIERFWYFSQYMLGASVRWGGGGKIAPGINSAWLVGSEHNAFTLDYNAEAQFYGTSSSNRGALTLPYARVVLDSVAGAAAESAFFQCANGLHFPGAVGPFGYYNFNWMHMHTHGSFAALPLIWLWEYERDVGLLLDRSLGSAGTNTTVYELVRGLAEWWVCHLTRETPTPAVAAAFARQNGNVNSHRVLSAASLPYIYSDLDDCAFEDTNYYTRRQNHAQRDNACNATAYKGRLDGANATSPLLRNPAIALGLAAKVLRAALDMSAALGPAVDASRRPVWADLVSHLAPFPSVNLTGPGEAGERLTAQEYPSYFPGSLNPLNTYALFPGEVIGAGSDAGLRAVGAATVATMGALGSWMQGNAFPQITNAAVRAGLPSAQILGNMSLVINATMSPGGMMREGAECGGAVQAVNDLLMSSYDGVLRLFAGWPRGEDAGFETLRAKGAFVVTANIAYGRLEGASIVSERGGPLLFDVAAPCSGDPAAAEMLSVTDTFPGSPRPRVVRQEHIPGLVVRWNTTAGHEYEVRCSD